MNDRPLPQYISYKRVGALKILSIRHHEDGSATITPADAGYGPFEVDEAYVRKHDPRSGGYFVVYEGGYQSWSPAEAFEAGYTRVERGDLP